VIIASNHVSNLDPPVVGCQIFRPHAAPAKQELFTHPIGGRILRQWGGIPVDRRRPGREVMAEMVAWLTQGDVLLIFPEGTRSRTGELLPGRPGTGKLIHDTRCKVVPVYHRGMHKLLPIGRKFPTFFNRIDVYVGEPVDMSDLFELPSSKETSRLVIDRVMPMVSAS